jgi:hypothetical protein
MLESIQFWWERVVGVSFWSGRLRFGNRPLGGDFGHDGVWSTEGLPEPVYSN